MDDHQDGGGQDEGKREIASLLARAAAALEEVKDAVVRSSQIGKIKLDATFLRRERSQLLRELGAGVYTLVREGSLELPESFANTIDQLAELDRGLAEQEKELAEVEAELRKGEGRGPTREEENS